MKKRKFSAVVIIAATLIISMLMFSSTAIAVPSSNLWYSETDLGAGWWQYDYTFVNTSDAGENLYSVFLDFTHESNAVGLALPSGWDGTTWMGANTTPYLDTFSIDTAYDIPSAGGVLNQFNFKVDYKAGDLAYTAYYTDGSVTTGTTVLAPEPISSVIGVISMPNLLKARAFKPKGVSLSR